MKRAFIVTIALAAFLLSFARLVVKVLESGAFDDLGRLLPPALAGAAVIIASCLWALVVDSVWIVGLFGVRQDRRDWRAWAMLSAYALLSISIQAIGITRELAWALPPAALVLALVILDLDQRPATAEPAPLARGQRLARVDTDDPEATLEWVHPQPSVRVDIRNNLHSQAAASAARADADTAVSTQQQDVDSGADRQQQAVDSHVDDQPPGAEIEAAPSTVRGRVRAVWTSLSTDQQRVITPSAFLGLMARHYGVTDTASTVRGELSLLRRGHTTNQ